MQVCRVSNQHRAMVSNTWSFVLCSLAAAATAAVAIELYVANRLELDYKIGIQFDELGKLVSDLRTQILRFFCENCMFQENKPSKWINGINFMKEKTVFLSSNKKLYLISKWQHTGNMHASKFTLNFKINFRHAKHILVHVRLRHFYCINSNHDKMHKSMIFHGKFYIDAFHVLAYRFLVI